MDIVIVILRHQHFDVLVPKFVLFYKLFIHLSSWSIAARIFLAVILQVMNVVWGLALVIDQLLNSFRNTGVFGSP